MAGTSDGGKKAADTIKKKLGKDHYRKLGAMGGKVGRTGGFAYLAKHNREKLIEISRKGGKAHGEIHNTKDREPEDEDLLFNAKES